MRLAITQPLDLVVPAALARFAPQNAVLLLHPPLRDNRVCQRRPALEAPDDPAPAALPAPAVAALPDRELTHQDRVPLLDDIRRPRVRDVHLDAARGVSAGPALCPLAARNQTALELNDELYKVIHDLRLAPIPLGGPSVLDASTFRWILRLMLYHPQGWPTFAGALGQLFVHESKRNLSAIAQSWGPVAAGTGLNVVSPDESNYGIMCSDSNTRTEDFEDVFAVSGALRGVSASLGDVGNTWTYPCARWPYHAKGAYDGGWEAGAVKTKNPPLFIGNTFDPVSPLANAYNGSEIFTGAGVLEHGGVGHGLLNHPSLCTAKAVRAYFQEGKLPEAGTACGADFDAFDASKTWKEAYLPELGWE